MVNSLARPRKEVDPLRRRLIKLMLISGLTAFAPIRAAAFFPYKPVQSKTLRLHNPVSEETITTAYWHNGHYVPEALERIDYIMRDHRTDEVKSIDLGLINLMHSIKLTLRTDEPIHVVSGYRCRKSNELLRKSGKRAARNSYHLKGQAADIRLPKCQLRSLRKVAIANKGGGVGYYPRNNFIHIDVGPIRYWTTKAM